MFEKLKKFAEFADINYHWQTNTNAFLVYHSRIINVLPRYCRALYIKARLYMFFRFWIFVRGAKRKETQLDATSFLFSFSCRNSYTSHINAVIFVNVFSKYICITVPFPFLPSMCLLPCRCVCFSLTFSLTFSTPFLQLQSPDRTLFLICVRDARLKGDQK